MKVLIVLAHPEIQSMNGAMYYTAVETLKQAGHLVTTTDLYREAFNPVSGRNNFVSVADKDYYKQQREEMYATEHNGFAPDIEAEQQKIEWCDLMIWQFPLWWFSVPGILKGWVDRVFAMGRMYGQGKMYVDGRFKDKKAMLSLTTGGPAENYRQNGLQGDIYSILKHIHRGMLNLTGFEVLQPQIIYGPVRLPEEQRQAELAAWRIRLQGIFEETEIEVGNY